MNSLYKKILNDFTSEKEFVEAIITNNTMVYYYLSQMIMFNNTTYKALEKKEGKNIAGHVLTDSLIIFRRQVKFEKIHIIFHAEKVYVNSRNNIELSDHLSKLFLLIIDTGPTNPVYEQSREFEKKLTDGQGFSKLYILKETIIKTLYTFGSKVPQDREDIFHESLLVFWNKLIKGELGIYFSGNSDKLENCRVYNREFYQNSKLNTFLTGIARNIFLYRTRTTDYNLTNTDSIELPEKGSIDQFEDKADNPALLMFLYYRNFVEQRKLRTVISVLQYDCNLEDKEVRTLIGINNARIHSCRLRNHFYLWYEQNQNKSQEVADKANEYFSKREGKKEKLNEKIRTIDLYHRNHINHFDLTIYKEEFLSMSEFEQFHRIFKYVFYFTATGKFSALTGLPDEKNMKILMGTYKNELSKLPNSGQILLLLYYGSDEPEEIIISLIKGLHSELSETDGHADSNLTKQLGQIMLQNQEVLESELYKTNHLLFNNFSLEEKFLNLITKNEIL